MLTVDADRPLDVDELMRRFGSKLRVAPNRLRLQRSGDGWRQDLLALFDAMAELYRGARINAGV